MTSIRILLTDDHALVRAGFRAILQKIEGFAVVGEAGDGIEALRLIESEKPDVVLLDITMPGLSGLEVASRISQKWPGVRAIMLSMHASEEFVLMALRAGAAGYLIKEAGPEELETAIRTVASGETYLSPSVSKHVVSGYLQRVRTPSNPVDQLTPRQKEVLQLIAEGMTNKEIARRLNISGKTVESHRTQLMERLDIHDIAGLVRFAIRVGLVKEG
jgi:DNA-binding NarL/FixJ family response regulator